MSPASAWSWSPGLVSATLQANEQKNTDCARQRKLKVVVSQVGGLDLFGVEYTISLERDLRWELVKRYGVLIQKITGYKMQAGPTCYTSLQPPQPWQTANYIVNLGEDEVAPNRCDSQMPSHGIDATARRRLTELMRQEHVVAPGATARPHRTLLVRPQDASAPNYLNMS
jgi:hypothetical protein